MRRATDRRGAARVLAAAGAAIAIVLVHAAPASAACELNLILLPCLEASFPADLALGDGDAGSTVTSAEQTVTVSSNQSWGLRIVADRADGRMREWTGSAYETVSPRTLTGALRWGLTSIAGAPQTPTYADLSDSAAAVVSGQSATACVLGLACGTRAIGVRLRQAFTFGDARIAPRTYRLRVTYTASHGF